MSRPEAQVPAALHPHTPALKKDLDTHTHTHTYRLSPPYHVPLHICHSGNRKRKGGIEQWKEREGGTQQTINSVAGRRGRKTERERETEKQRKGERENNKVSLVGINLPHTAGVSVEARW